MKREKTGINTEQIVVRVSPAIKARLDAYCQRNGLAIAEMVRCLMLGFLDGEDERHRKETEK